MRITVHSNLDFRSLTQTPRFQVLMNLCWLLCRYRIHGIKYRLDFCWLRLLFLKFRCGLSISVSFQCLQCQWFQCVLFVWTSGSQRRSFGATNILVHQFRRGRRWLTVCSNAHRSTVLAVANITIEELHQGLCVCVVFETWFAWIHMSGSLSFQILFQTGWWWRLFSRCRWTFSCFAVTVI